MPVIAVSGPPGSGKSTIARAVAAEFGLRYVSAGSIFRNVAKQMGIGLDQLSIMAERDHSIDRAIDDETRKEEEKGNVVLDGHLTAWIARDAVKIYVKASPEVRYERIAKRDSTTLEEATRANSIRERSEAARFKEIYGYDINDLTIFDLVIDTTYVPAESANAVVITFLRAHKKIKGAVEDRSSSQG
ncbi:MAG: (d)CMP kinase [Thermoprotei archaeon]|nr:AAA family ATPase [TACK group archaeon]